MLNVVLGVVMLSVIVLNVIILNGIYSCIYSMKQGFDQVQWNPNKVPGGRENLEPRERLDGEPRQRGSGDNFQPDSKSRPQSGTLKFTKYLYPPPSGRLDMNL
jgi:hypothetical protein